MTAPPPRRVILCPLQIEAHALRKAQLPEPVKVCGPGAEAVETAVLELIRGGDPPKIILAGVAGGLDPGIQAGEARWITRVVSPDGSLVGQDSQFNPSEAAACTVCSVDSPIITRKAKQELQEATGADLVDMESQRFVEVCQREAVSWAILRGVSDGAAEQLPGGVQAMVDARGLPRHGQVLKFILSHPWELPNLIRLSLKTSKAMKQVAKELSS